MPEMAAGNSDNRILPDAVSMEVTSSYYQTANRYLVSIFFMINTVSVNAPKSDMQCPIIILYVRLI